MSFTSMDNHHVDVTCQGKDALLLALRLAFGDRNAEYYAVINGALVFFWTEPCTLVARRESTQLVPLAVQKKMIAASERNDVRFEIGERVEELYKFEVTKCLYTMDYAAATEIAESWLKHSAQYGEQPDHDGSNGKGWHVFNGAWGHVFGLWEGICAVAPEWAWYGK